MCASARIAAVVLIAPALLIGAALLAGCSNSPDSLRFELTADPAVVPAGGPVGLTVRLASADRTIAACRPTPGALDITVTRLDSGESQPGQQIVECGGAFLFYPYLSSGVVATVMLLDVADVFGRYIVLAPDRERRFTFELRGTRGGHFMLVDPARLPRNVAFSRKVFQPGRYRVDVTYESERFIVPLFWPVIAKKLTASAEFRVAG